MEWLPVPIAFLALLLCALVALFLSSAWERRKKRDESFDALLELLPGHDCGLCGAGDCRGYAKSLAEAQGNPSLCAPGGSAVESALRESLGGARLKPQRAIVRCGGSREAAAELYAYTGKADCVVASGLFVGTKRCRDACLGLGSCAKACPLGAIKMENGLARIDAERCTGCGACISSCPKGLIALVPADSPWHVACSAKAPPETRKADCSRACDACGECVRLSPAWEFSLEGGLAKASTSIPGSGVGAGAFASIAPRCPTGAIRSAQPEKKRISSS